MHVCLIVSSVKIITKRVVVMYRFKSARVVSVMLRRICVFLGCDMPIQLVLSSDREYDDYDRLEDHFSVYRFTPRTTKYVTLYA